MHSPSSPESPTIPGTQAVARGLRLLKLFAQHGELTPKVAQERTGLNRTTVFRLLRALEAEGMIERVREGEAFRVGPASLALHRRRVADDLVELAAAEMKLLARDLGETVSLEKLEGTEVVILAEAPGEPAPGDHVMVARSYVGTRWPAHATSTGKVLLAHLEREEQERRLKGKLELLTPSTQIRKPDLSRELDGVREQGWAACFEELEPGYHAVAVPLRGPAGEVVAALSLGGPTARLPRARTESVAQTLARAASSITQRLQA